MVTSKKTVASKTETPAKTAASKTTTASAKSSATKTAAPKPATKAAAKAPAVKQEAVKQEAVSTPVAAVEPQAAAKPVEVSVAAAVTVTISPEQRTNYVQMAAYYIAERRGFAPGNPDEDWLAAEAEVDRLIASGHFSQ